MIFVDSNIWCYYFDSSANEHKEVASYLDSVLGKEDIIMNAIVAMEISHYLIKNLGPLKGKEKIGTLLEFPFMIEDFDYGLLLEAVEMLTIYSHAGIGGRDAAILATMKRQGIKNIVTHDKSFRKIDFVNVIDPISK